MFGRGRFQAGVLVDPKSNFKFDSSDKVKLADFRNLIWYVLLISSSADTSLLFLECRPTIEKMNMFAPQHSRLFKEVCNHEDTI